MPRSYKCFLGPVLTTLLPFSASQAQQPVQAVTSQQPSESGVTLHSATQLVIVDVVVTDKHQNPVHNLRAADFTLLEKNVPQQIKNFEEHTALPATDTAKLPAIPPMPPGTFTNFSLVPGDGPTNILLLDTLNTPIADQVYARDQIKRYLKNANPTSHIAIFGLHSHLILLQGFTSDPELLKAALDQETTRPSHLLNDPVGGGTGPQSLSSSWRDSDAFNGSAAAAAVLANLQQFDAQEKAFEIQTRTKYTLDAFNQLARSLADVPGRKNLLWFSGSFPINLLPDTDPMNPGRGNFATNEPFDALVNSENDVHETANLLATSQIAVYPIDVRGLIGSPVNNASQANRGYIATDLHASTFDHDENQFIQQNISEHTTMTQMADQTGGRAFVDSNDLTQAVTKSLQAGSNYYTLTYSPTNAHWNGDFRSIQVKLQQQGLTLAYRRGYYANEPNAPTRKGDPTVITAPERVTLNAMRSAMLHGGPNPTQIIFKVRILPAASEPEDQLAPHNTLNPDLKTKGPYRRYVIDYAASPRNILFNTSPDGTHTGALQFLTYLYDKDGTLVSVADNKTHANLTPSAYANLMSHGIPWQEEISVPVKGEFYLRIGIHDITSDHVGAVEVPIAFVKNLSPASPPPTTKTN